MATRPVGIARRILKSWEIRPGKLKTIFEAMLPGQSTGIFYGKYAVERSSLQNCEIGFDSLTSRQAELAQVVEHLVEAQSARVQVLDSEPSSISSIVECPSDTRMTEGQNLDRVPMAYRPKVGPHSYKVQNWGQYPICRPQGLAQRKSARFGTERPRFQNSHP